MLGLPLLQQEIDSCSVYNLRQMAWQSIAGIAYFGVGINT